MTQPPPPEDPQRPPAYPGTPAGDGGSYPPPPGGYPPPGYQSGPPRTSQLAVWSMVTGIIAIVLGLIGACGVIFGPVALGLGIPAKRQTAASHGQLKGGGMATAGIVLGAIGAVISIVWIILFATGAVELPEV